MRQLLRVSDIAQLLGIAQREISELLTRADAELVFDGRTHYVDIGDALRALGVELAREKTVDVVTSDNTYVLLTVQDAADRLQISVSKLYELIAHNEIETVTIGRSRRVPTESLRC